MSNLNLPLPGEIVIYHLPDDFEEHFSIDYRLGMRDAPALVAYQTGQGGIDVEVFCLGKQASYGHVVEGTEPGQWSWPEKRPAQVNPNDELISQIVDAVRRRFARVQ